MEKLGLLKIGVVFCLLLGGGLISLAGLTTASDVAAAELPGGTGPLLSVPDPASPPPAPPGRPLLQAPVLTITKTADPDPAVAGELLVYTIEVTGDPISDVTGVVISDELDSNVTFDAASHGGSETGGVVTWSSFDLSALGTASRMVTVTVGQVVSGTTLSNTASVTSTEGANDIIILPTTVQAEADLEISKTNNQTSSVPGEAVLYNIIVTNTGPSVVTGATVIDDFPSMSSVSWTCNESGGAICPSTSGSGNLDETVNLPVDGVLTYLAVGTVASAATGTLVNTASVAAPASVFDPASGNNSAIDSDELTPETDLSVTKTDSPDPVFAGNILTYSLTVNNGGPSDATGVTLVDNLPSSGIIFISANPSQGSCGGISTVTCNLGTIVSGDNATVSIQVRVDPAWEDTLTNQASVSGGEEDPNPFNNFTLPVYSTVKRETDLEITKSASPNPLLGNPFTYTLTVVNKGPSTASGVQVTDDLPPEVTLVSAETTLGTCNDTDPVECNLGTMVKNDTAQVTIVVDPQSTGSVVNTASVTGDQTDPTSDNDSDSVNVTVNADADLSVSMTDSPDPVLPGENLTYDITVVNNGPSPANGVSLSDSLPGGVSLVSATPSQGSCTPGNPVDCSLGNLAKNGSATVQIVVKVNDSTTGNLSNEAIVSSSTPDSNSDNDSATVTTAVGEFEFVFLPIIFKPEPTELYVQNDNTGANVTFIVRQLSGSEVTRCTVANNQTQKCDHNGDDSHIFPPGTYQVEVNARCGSETTTKTYASGRQTTRIFCK
jgi:uncharacterized repeat protein (TIGR01451 family)